MSISTPHRKRLEQAETGRAPMETIAEVARILQLRRERKRPAAAPDGPAEDEKSQPETTWS